MTMLDASYGSDPLGRDRKDTTVCLSLPCQAFLQRYADPDREHSIQRLRSLVKELEQHRLRYEKDGRERLLAKTASAYTDYHHELRWFLRRQRKLARVYFQTTRKVRWWQPRKREEWRAYARTLTHVWLLLLGYPDTSGGYGAFDAVNLHPTERFFAHRTRLSRAMPPGNSQVWRDDVSVWYFLAQAKAQTPDVRIMQGIKDLRPVFSPGMYEELYAKDVFGTSIWPIPRLLLPEWCEEDLTALEALVTLARLGPHGSLLHLTAEQAQLLARFENQQGLLQAWKHFYRSDYSTQVAHA